MISYLSMGFASFRLAAGPPCGNRRVHSGPLAFGRPGARFQERRKSSPAAIFSAEEASFAYSLRLGFIGARSTAVLRACKTSRLRVANCLRQLCPPGTRFFVGKPKIYGGSESSRRVSFSYLYPGRHVSQVRRRVIREYFRGIGFPHRFPLCTFSIPEGFGNW